MRHILLAIILIILTACSGSPTIIVLSVNPTPTPSPSTPTPASLPPQEILTGSGDSVININKWPGPALIHLTGNSTSGFFSVTRFDADNNQLSAPLVFTTEPYEGFRLLDLDPDDHTARFEIKAEGDWQIEIFPLSTARTLIIPGSIEGSNDDVISLTGGTPDVATITGNAEESFFSIIPHGGLFSIPLVFTTEPYIGQVIIDSEIILLEIQARGDWTISITER